MTRPTPKDGELYAGIILGKDGERNYHLYLLPDKTPTERLNWQDSMNWVSTVGGDLPTQREQSLLFANLKEEFAAGYYWSNEQYADGTDYAGVQGFGIGDQHNNHKSNEYRARAVRREYI
jgi:hypothetical protein